MCVCVQCGNSTEYNERLRDHESLCYYCKESSNLELKKLTVIKGNLIIKLMRSKCNGKNNYT